MTEIEYCVVSNLAHITDALNSMRQLSPFDDCGITKEEAKEIKAKLRNAQVKCQGLIEVDNQ